MDILCISSRSLLWEELRPYIEAHKGRLYLLPSLEAGLERLRDSPVTLVILDLALNAQEIRAAVIEVIKVNAMIHCTAVSCLSKEEFHDSMEGLGIPMGLPDPPMPQDIEKLIDTLAMLQSGQA